MITKKNSAFLLVEVLVTVVIVSVSIIVINHAFSSSLKATGLSNDYIKALFLLEDKSFDFETDPVSGVEQDSGEEEFAGVRFYWGKSVSALEDEELGDDYNAEEIGLNRLALSVEWEKQNVKRRIELLTYVRAEESEE